MNSFYIFSKGLFVLILLRASLDPILDISKVGGIGLGALLNLIIVLISFSILYRFKFQLSKAILLAWLPFLLLGLLSVFISPEKVSSMRSFFAILTYFSCFLIPFYYIKSPQDVFGLIRLTVYSSVLPLCVAFFEFAFPAGSTGSNGFRVSGSFSHPNIFAFYLVLISTICFFTIKSNRFVFEYKFLKYVKVIFLLSVVCLLATKTRSAWIALIIIFFTYGVLVEKKYIFYLILLALVALLIPSIQERIFDIFSGNSVDVLDEGGKLNSYAWRQVVWNSAWSFILDKPFFGHGYNTFSYYFLDFFPLESSKGFDAHNVYVQIAFDMGFLGVISYFSLFVTLLYRASFYYKIDKKGGALVIGLLISYLVVGYSDNMLFYLSYNWYFWFFIGIFFCCSKLNYNTTN